MFGKVIDKVIFIDSEIWYIHKLKISDKKKRVLLTTTESQVAENKGDEWDIYINYNMNPLAKFRSGIRSIQIKDIFPHWISDNIMKTFTN